MAVLSEPTYCECGFHLVDVAAHRPLCPVCLDQVRLDAVARVAEMGWRVFGTGGRA